ncbi:MAG: phosphoadenosine phosphosulfate reductase family protein [Fulvivirga sp.]
MNEVKIAWWSAGVTSAVACKIALEQYDNVKLYYIETGAAHSDNQRFLKECQDWYDHEIITAQNRKGYMSPLDVALKERYINGPEGAKCTQVLKKDVRYDIEKLHEVNLFNSVRLTNQIFGYEWNKKEVNRAIRFLQQYPDANGLFPLIERRITKPNCASILLTNGIDLPALYKLGYNNNNCIGCFKGGKGYWNKIRIDFPYYFWEVARAERVIGRSCINGVFLDELDPEEGLKVKPIVPDCGVFCNVEIADIPAKKLNLVLNGEISIYEAA